MDRIQELVQIGDNDIIEMGKSIKVLQVRDRNLPLIDSRNFLKTSSRDINQDYPMAAVLNHKDQLYAFRIGAVIGQMQVVVKPLNESLSCEAITGAAILGDGSAALIADVDGLIKLYLKNNFIQAA
jgi:two-component system chemotaxis sensor kinase CheA